MLNPRLRFFVMDVRRLLFVRGLKLVPMPTLPGLLPEPPSYSAQHFYEEAVRFLISNDLVQASEKIWTCVIFEVKKTMFNFGVDIRSHNGLNRVAEFLETCDVEDTAHFRLGWREAEALHRNFYTNTLDAASVQTGILHAVKFVEELEKMKPTSIGARLQPFLQREMARGRLEIVTGEKVHHGGIPYNVTHRINF